MIKTQALKSPELAVKWFTELAVKCLRLKSPELAVKWFMKLAVKWFMKLAVKWFMDNQMIVNQDKFQAIILQNSRNSKNNEPVKLGIGSTKIETKNTRKLLGTTIDN